MKRRLQISSRVLRMADMEDTTFHRLRTFKSPELRCVPAIRLRSLGFAADGGADTAVARRGAA